MWVATGWGTMSDGAYASIAGNFRFHLRKLVRLTRYWKWLIKRQLSFRRTSLMIDVCQSSCPSTHILFINRPVGKPCTMHHALWNVSFLSSAHSANWSLLYLSQTSRTATVSDHCWDILKSRDAFRADCLGLHGYSKRFSVFWRTHGSSRGRFSSLTTTSSWDKWRTVFRAGAQLVCKQPKPVSGRQ
jgi:hypothetical protein